MLGDSIMSLLLLFVVVAIVLGDDDDELLLLLILFELLGSVFGETAVRGKKAVDNNDGGLRAFELLLCIGGRRRVLL